MQATYFDFASTKISFFSSHWPNGLCLFLFFCLQWVQHLLAYFSLREVRLLTSHGVTCSLNELLKKHVGWIHGAVHPTTRSPSLKITCLFFLLACALYLALLASIFFLPSACSCCTKLANSVAFGCSSLDNGNLDKSRTLAGCIP